MSNTKVYYSIKKPAGARKTFSITRMDVTNGTKVNSTVNDERLDSINNSFLSRTLDINQAYEAVVALKDSLKVPPVLATDYVVNKDLCDLFLDDYKLTRDVEEITINGTELQLKKLRKVLKNTDFRSLDKHSLYKIIANSELTNHAKDRLIITCNMISQFLNTPANIIKKRFQNKNIAEEINYCSEDEMLKTVFVNQEIDPDICIVIQKLFYTGMRTSEFMALQKPNFNKAFLVIRTQKTRNKEVKNTKNSKNRAIPLIPAAIGLINDVLRINQEISHTEICRRVKQAFKRAGYDISPHDLRHSYAMWLRTKNVSIETIAQLLGNRLEVCMRHYAGFSLKENEIENVLAKIS